VTFVWFVIWLIANSVGGSEPLELDPVGFWAAALVLSSPSISIARDTSWRREGHRLARERGRDESLAHHEVDRLREIAAPQGAELGGPMR
jgi:hypothetical protein